MAGRKKRAPNIDGLPKPGDAPKRGQKRVPIDLDMVERMASLFATEKEIAIMLGIRRSTFYDRKKLSGDFRAAIAKGRTNLKVSIKRQLRERMMKNDRVLIYLDKKYCAPPDRLVISTGKEGLKVKHEITDDERLERIRKLADIAASDPTLPPKGRSVLQGLMDAARKPKR